MLCQLSYTPVNAWCTEWESNPHVFRHSDLNAARLPITPSVQRELLEHGARFELARTFVVGFAIRCLQPLGHPCRYLRSTRQRARAGCYNHRHRARVVWWGRMDSNHRVFWSLVYSQVRSASLPHPHVRSLGSDLVRVCWNSRQQSLIEKNVPGPLQSLSSRGEQTGSPPGHQVWKHAVVVRIPSHANSLLNHDQAL